MNEKSGRWCRWYWQVGTLLGLLAHHIVLIMDANGSRSIIELRFISDQENYEQFC